MEYVGYSYHILIMFKCKVFYFYFDNEIWFYFNQNFIFQLQLGKGMNVPNKMYEKSWEPASERRKYV